MSAPAFSFPADTTVLEREIDQQVHVLYGLIPEEIKTVEEAKH